MNPKLFRVVSIFCLAVAVVLSTALLVQAQLKKPDPPPAEQQNVGPLFHTISACTLCFTCGGSWPSAEGEIVLGATRSVLERGSGCSGSPRRINDFAPRLCCNPAD
jgi:hypothetical protein